MLRIGPSGTRRALLRSDPEEFREPGEPALGQNTAADSGNTGAAAKSVVHR
jgi:hypothetical protein